ncbi:MAG: molybdenum cofactor guanylyltransferase [Eubacteriales bacterium]|nr:molybdenum cofactor guanylyltransferase [Eubacteriales bacterium]
MELDGLILAGGRSARMGGNHKGELIYRKHTFVERILKEFEKEADNIWLSYGTEKKREYPGCRIVMDICPDCGPIGGLHAGLCACRSDGLMAAACDMPLLEIELFRYLHRQMEQKQRETGTFFQGAVPVTNGRMHPLAAIYRKDMKEILEEQIRKENYRMTDALKRADILYADVTDQKEFERMLRNVNTASEYEALVWAEEKREEQRAGWKR